MLRVSSPVSCALPSPRSYPELFASHMQTHPDSPDQGNPSHRDSRFDFVETDCEHHVPKPREDWPVIVHCGSQAELLAHVAEQANLLLKLLEAGVGKQPGNQLAEELKEVIFKISRLEHQEERDTQLSELNSALVKRSVTAIDGGPSVIAELSRVIELNQPGPFSTSSADHVAHDFFKCAEPGKIREYVAEEVETLKMLAAQTSVPAETVNAERKTLLDRINLVEDPLERAELIRQVNSSALLRAEAGAPTADGLESMSSIARDNPEIKRLVQVLAAQELFRGLTTTSEGYVERAVLEDGTARWRAPDASVASACVALDGGNTLKTLQAIQGAGKVFMPLMWGFRVFNAAEGLAAREVNTIKAYATMAQSLQGSVEARAPLILADIHAQHNKIPPEIYEPYYCEVERVAHGLGVKTIRLSAIYKQLDVTLEQVEGWGPALVQKPVGKSAQPESTALTELPGDYWAHLKKQAKHTVARFPGVFDVPKGYKPSEKFYGDKALHYAQFRASEGERVLQRLGELTEANGAPVLVAHVADPSSGLVGVNGLYIRAKDNANNTVTGIPWGKPEESSTP